MNDSRTRGVKRARKGEKPSRAEIVLAAVAVGVVLGWIFWWLDADTERDIGLVFPAWCPWVSFLGALSVVVYVALKPFGFIRLPRTVESKVVPILSLVPVLGYLVSILFPVYTFLAVGGSIALAYLSATIYWRRQFEFAGRKIAGDEGEDPKTRPAPSEPPSPRPAENSSGDAVDPAPPGDVPEERPSSSSPDSP